MDHQHWSRFADEWITWARTPDHDAFWAYRSSLLGFVAPGTGQALDLGCGEGRVSRLLRQCGYRVTATDPVEQLLSAARPADSADTYSVAAAACLPFEDASFDLVMAYNVLMDVADLRAAVAECRRVLRPSGTFVVSIVHPISDRGRFAGPQADAPFVLHDSYFARSRFEGAEERNGLCMHFAGWSYPLEDYVAALQDAGLAITSLREPIPDIAEAWRHTERWRRVPLFLWLKARPLSV